MPSAAEGATKQATKKSRKADALRYDYLPRIHSKNWENSTYIFKQVFFFKNNKITFDENENKFFLQKKYFPHSQVGRDCSLAVACKNECPKICIILWSSKAMNGVAAKISLDPRIKQL